MRDEAGEFFALMNKYAKPKPSFTSKLRYQEIKNRLGKPYEIENENQCMQREIHEIHKMLSFFLGNREQEKKVILP